MAIRRFDVRVAAVVRVTKVPYDVVLKDYALGYMLAGIYSKTELSAGMVFKGGTALRKCYFRGYRFSQDLDFTMVKAWEEERVRDALSQAAEEATRLTSVYGPFRFALEPVKHREAHPFGQLDFRVRVQFPTGASLPIKIEVTRDEPVLRPIATLDLIHLFEEEPLTAKIGCYSLEEIAVEKIRAFLQARRNLRRREWLNRSRDLYDLWFLHRQAEYPIEWSSLLSTLRTKTHARGEGFTGPDDFRDRKVLGLYERQWEAQLRDFVAELPNFGAARLEFDRVLDDVFSPGNR